MDRHTNDVAFGRAAREQRLSFMSHVFFPLLLFFSAIVSLSDFVQLIWRCNYVNFFAIVILNVSASEILRAEYG